MLNARCSFDLEIVLLDLEAEAVVPVLDEGLAAPALEGAQHDEQRHGHDHCQRQQQQQ